VTSGWQCGIPKSHFKLQTPNFTTYISQMASFEDYDEFGNYIGADLDSDDEEEPSQQLPPGDSAFEQYESLQEPLEGFTEMGPSTSAMEVDG
jgi:116 kDa U5 small nuclear ribonucleoprotein component